MKRAFAVVIATLLAIGSTTAFRGPGVTSGASLPSVPVAHWSLEAQRAIVPPPAGSGNKFPGEAAVYMAIVHIAMHDVAVAIQGGYRPCASAVTGPTDSSSAAAIATAAHGDSSAVMRDVLCEHPQKPRGVDDDDVIEAFPSDRTDDAFRVGVLPGDRDAVRTVCTFMPAMMRKSDWSGCDHCDPRR